MSGYLDVKSPFKSSKGFSTWKVWKKQWCTLRPCPVKSGIAIVIHSSANVSSYTQIDIPSNVIICRIVSKTKPYAFGIFTNNESEKPLIYLSGHSESESQLWMLRIRMMINGKHFSEKCPEKKTYLNVSLIDNEFSKKCGYRGVYGTLKMKSDNFEIWNVFKNEIIASFEYKNISSINFLDVDSKFADYQKICIINTNSKYKFGCGELHFYSSYGKMLLSFLRKKINSSEVTFRKLNRRISRSEGSLMNLDNYKNLIENSENIEVLTYDESPYKHNINHNKSIPFSPLPKLEVCQSTSNLFRNENLHSIRRCSSISLASGIYEEIAEVITTKNDSTNCTYESLNECIYLKNNIVTKRSNPPPLPPRHNAQNLSKFESDSDEKLSHSQNSINSPFKNGSSMSLNVLSRNCNSTQKLNYDKQNYVHGLTKLPVKNSSRFHNAFDAFRKRIKSESNIQKNKYLKYETDKSPNPSTNLIITPTKSSSLFRNMRLGKGIKSSKLNDLKSAACTTASCETLDKQSECNIIKNRLSKSHDCLDSDFYDEDISVNKRYKIDLSKNWCTENSDDNMEDLSLLYPEDSFKPEYPDDIIDLILKGDIDSIEQKLKQRSNDEYVVMSPMGLQISKQEKTNISNDPIISGENNYLVMRSA